jgi:hypothetical protein
MSSATDASSIDPTSLGARIGNLDLRDNVRELDELGYTMVQDPVAHTLNGDGPRRGALHAREESMMHLANRSPWKESK